MERAMGRSRRRRGALSDGPFAAVASSLERVALHVVNGSRVGLMVEIPHGVVTGQDGGPPKSRLGEPRRVPDAEALDTSCVVARRATYRGSGRWTCPRSVLRAGPLPHPNNWSSH